MTTSLEQRREILNYLLNCKVKYSGNTERSQTTRIRKLIEFCDLSKLNWAPIEDRLLTIYQEKQEVVGSEMTIIGNTLFSKPKLPRTC